MENWMNWPWSEMLLASITLPALLAIVLLLSNKYPASRYLGKLIASGLFIIFSVVLFQTAWIAIITMAVILYLYTRAFFLQNTRINWIHILPIIIVLLLSYSPGLAHLQLAIRSILTLIVLGYIFRMIFKLNKEGKLRGIPWFKNPGSRLVWFRNFVAYQIVFLLFLIINYDNLILGYLATAILIQLGFVYYQLIKESAFLSPMLLGNKYQKSALGATHKYNILNKLNAKLSEGKFYLESTVSLSSLAKELHTTTHHLSQVINESKRMSFQELISQYRIREAKRILRDPSHQQAKIETIALMVGYYSKSSFNTAFKKYTGLTPKEYKQSKNVRPYRNVHQIDQKGRFSKNILVSWYHVLSVTINEIMVNNFLKIFLRTLKRNKAFTAINLFGLTLGFCCSIFIYLFISDEMSFDKGIPDNEDIYRISWINENPQTRTPHPMAQAMAESFPEVEAATSISPWYGAGLNLQSIKVKNVEKDIIFEEPNFFFADSTFLDVFQLQVLAGDSSALKKPWSFVITETMSKKYFGEEDAIGKELIVDDMPLSVSAVVKGMPKNSHFHFNALISYVSLKKINPDNPWLTWGDFGHFNYIRTKPGTDKNNLQAKIADWVSPYLNWSSEAIASLKRGDIYFELQPITDIHLHSHLRWELESNGNISYVYILSFTLFFIILIVIINYVNLTTAKSLNRAKEVGIRKTMGAMPKSLKWQFYSESFFVCFAAVLLALVLALTFLDVFNLLAHKSFMPTDIFNAGFLLKIFLATTLLSILAGFYPAFVLTSFDPTLVLKGKFSNSGHGTRLRGILVVLQFFVSAVLITGSVVVLKQIDFMKNKDLGFDKEAVVSIKIHQSVEIGGIDQDKLQGLETKFKSIPGVIETSAVSNLPGEQFDQNPIYLTNDPSNQIDVSEMYVDFNLIDVLNLQLVKGRNFDRSHSDDVKGLNFIINETAAKQLQLKQPIGNELTWETTWENYKGNIIGVVKDFHFKSMHEQIQPLIIKIDPGAINYLAVKLDGRNFQKSLSEMKTAYQAVEAEVPFEYHFLDQQLADLYNNEVRTLNVFAVFTGIALFLACLGLLGMAMAILNQKIKEVGVRKILGASSSQVMGMILSKFARLITLALLMGLPIGYLLMQRWLSEFSYQVALGFIPFIIAGVVMIVVAIASVSVIVLKIAFSNPVDALRYE
ncbi:MAG TPA: ABC transporter permease [Fulvivirga sp.]|nr:ABC transporter permease [Fulvivirga sp.]